jgi:hypothetical protein
MDPFETSSSVVLPSLLRLARRLPSSPNLMILISVHSRQAKIKKEVTNLLICVRAYIAACCARLASLNGLHDILLAQALTYNDSFFIAGKL